MKPCPRCNHEVQEDQTECPECGVVFAKWDAAHSSSPTPVSPTVSATGKFTPHHQKYLGLVLVILSLLLFILAGVIKVPTIAGISFGIVWLLSGIGLALYAKGSGRSLVWGFLLGLYPPFLGPLIGLWAFAKNKKIEPKTKTGMSDAAFKWNVLLYAACLVLAALLAPRALWSRIFLAENDIWSALAQVFMGMDTMFGLMLALFVVVRLLLDIEKAGVSPGWRKASAWLVVRAVLAGLVIAIIWFGLKANKDIEQKADSLIEESLGRIKPGMERAVVHELILEANTSLLPKPHTLLSTTQQEEAAYDEVRNELKIGQAGGQADFQKLHGIFFHTNKQSSFEKSQEHQEVYETLDAGIRPGTSKKDPEHREIFVRNCCAFVFQWTRYDLFIEYDMDDHLKFVRYLKSRHEDARDRSCHVRLEIPASKDKQYPYPCPPDVQDF